MDTGVTRRQLIAAGTSLPCAALVPSGLARGAEPRLQARTAS